MNENQKLMIEAQRACERMDVMKMLSASDELLRREPNNVDAMFIAGTALQHAGQEGLGLIVRNAARSATTDAHKLGAIWNNIACALQEYQPAEAYKAFRKSLEYGDPPPSVYDNLCNVASQIGRHAEALDWASKSTTLDPSYNKSFALMHLGRWAEAWREYSKSAGTATRPHTDRDYGVPRWDGKAPGKVIIHGEQGIGDEIMFMSMLPRDFAGVIDCNPRTEGLFRRAFPRAKVYGTLLQTHLEWPFAEKADWHLEMGGIGEFFASDPIRNAGFLSADPARRAGQAAWIAGAVPALGRPNVRVGLAWTGGTWATGRARRSIPFPLIGELIQDNPGVTFVNLEYEDRREELEPFPDVLNPHWATNSTTSRPSSPALISSLRPPRALWTSPAPLAWRRGRWSMRTPSGATARPQARTPCGFTRASAVSARRRSTTASGAGWWTW
jgi:hypothetical protein